MPPTPFPFLLLPPKIRLQIYTHALLFTRITTIPHGPTTIHPSSARLLTLTPHDPAHILALFSVSRQVSAESVSVFYGGDVFHRRSRERLEGFLRGMGEGRFAFLGGG